MPILCQKNIHYLKTHCFYAHLNQCGRNRFVPRKNPKIEKELFNLFLRYLVIFSKKRGSHRFSAGASGSARDKQFSAGNRFMPRFLRFSINYHSNRKI